MFPLNSIIHYSDALKRTPATSVLPRGLQRQVTLMKAIAEKRRLVYAGFLYSSRNIVKI